MSKQVLDLIEELKELFADNDTNNAFGESSMEDDDTARKSFNTIGKRIYKEKNYFLSALDTLYGAMKRRNAGSNALALKKIASDFFELIPQVGRDADRLIR